MRKYSIGTITKKQILAAFNAVEDAQEELNDYIYEYADEDFGTVGYFRDAEHLTNIMEDCYQEAIEMLYAYNDDFATYIDIDLQGNSIERCVENAIWCIEHDEIPVEVV